MKINLSKKLKKEADHGHSHSHMLENKEPGKAQVPAKFYICYEIIDGELFMTPKGIDKDGSVNLYHRGFEVKELIGLFKPDGEHFEIIGSGSIGTIQEVKAPDDNPPSVPGGAVLTPAALRERLKQQVPIR
jgi:hypothetical protein